MNNQAPPQAVIKLTVLRDIASNPSVLSGKIIEALAGRYRFIPVLLAIACVWVFFYAMNPNFLTPRNITNLTVQIVVTTTLAIGLVLILIIREIDLSIAALSALSAAITATMLINYDFSATTAVASALVSGSVFGLMQGFIITRFRVASFVITLGASLAMQGLLLLLLPANGSFPLAGTPIQWIANSFISPTEGFLSVVIVGAIVAALQVQTAEHRKASGLPVNKIRVILLPVTIVMVIGSAIVAILNEYRGVPVPVVILFAILAAMSYITTQTKFGTYLYAVGGSSEASRRAGINVVAIRIATFMLSGSFAALAGLIAASRTLGVSSLSGGGTLLLEAVAAAVIGGASLFGGRGSVWAALIGALLIGSISNGLSLISAPTEVKYLVQGAVLIIAVIIDSIVGRDTLKG